MTVLDELDERVVAKSSLDAADERLRSLCASHAPTFVAVEHRSASLERSLRDLLESVKDDVGPKVERAREALESSSGGVVVGDDERGTPRDDGGGDGSSGVEGVGGGGSSSGGGAESSLAALAERHRLRRRTLLQHSSLLELLELPNLMDACVRSGLYDEALGIAGFANALERRHLLREHRGGGGGDGGGDGETTAGGKPPSSSSSSRGAGGGGHRVVAGVVSEIRRREDDLRRHLLHRLRGDVTMPQCLEVVTALRRLNGVELERRGQVQRHRQQQQQQQQQSSDPSAVAAGALDLERVHAAMELRLQVDFFEARDAWLDAVATPPSHRRPLAGTATMSAAPSSSGLARQGSGGAALAGQSEQLLDGIERYRTRCFEIATQFIAIFRASNPSAAAALPSGPIPKGAAATTTADDRSLSLLSMWTTRRVHAFLSALRTQLSPLRDAGPLRDALDAAVFFATSMGRIGSDFQSLLPAVFEPKMIDVVTCRWTEGSNALADALKVCRDAGVAGPLFSTAAPSKDASADASSSSGAGAAPSGTTPTPPPRSLLSLPPLARLVNAYLSGLNELRRCLLPGTFPPLRRALDRLSEDVRTTLQTNERAVLTPGLRGEATKLREVASEMRSVFDGTVEPYFRSSLNVAFGCVEPVVVVAEENSKEEEDEDEDEGKDKAAEEAGSGAATGTEENPVAVVSDDEDDEGAEATTGEGGTETGGEEDDGGADDEGMGVDATEAPISRGNDDDDDEDGWSEDDDMEGEDSLYT